MTLVIVDANKEATALRQIIPHLRWQRLAEWAQVYLNPDVRLSYSRTLYWRKRADEMAVRCYTAPVSSNTDTSFNMKRMVDVLETIACRIPPANTTPSPNERPSSLAPFANSPNAHPSLPIPRYTNPNNNNARYNNYTTPNNNFRTPINMNNNRNPTQNNTQNRIPFNSTPQNTFQSRQPYHNTNPTNTFQPRQPHNNNTPNTNRNFYNNPNPRIPNHQNATIPNTQPNERPKPHPQRYMNAQLNEEPEYEEDIEHSLFTYARLDEAVLQEEQSNEQEETSDFA